MIKTVFVVLVSFLALNLCANAGPRARSLRSGPLAKFEGVISRETGMEVEQVRRYVLEHLGKDTRFAEELVRLKRAQRLDNATERAIVSALKRNAEFRATVGLQALVEPSLRVALAASKMTGELKKQLLEATESERVDAILVLNNTFNKTIKDFNGNRRDYHEALQAHAAQAHRALFEKIAKLEQQGLQANYLKALQLVVVRGTRSQLLPLIEDASVVTASHNGQVQLID